MTLAELGAKLREAREGREMKVADAADRLKIPARILQGIEEGSDRVPRTVYVHHFIKEYALLLGFAQDEVTEWLRSLEGFENISRPVIADNATYTSVKPSVLPVIIGGVLKVALVVALACGAYMAYVHFFAARDYESAPAMSDASSTGASVPTWGTAAPVPAPAPAAQSAAVTQESAVVQENGVTQENGVEQMPADPAATGPAAVAEAPASGTENVSAPAADAAAAASGNAVQQPAAAAVEEASADAQPSAAALPDGMHQVEVIADTGDCWMGFEPDGKKQQRTLRKGDTFSMTFRDSLVIRLGNARAVRIIYDGRELERSTSPRVVTMNFPSDVR